MTFCSLMFFDLKDFKYSFLFENVSFFGEILRKVEIFLDTYSYKGISAFLEEGVFFKNKNKIEIGKGSIIESGAYVQGPLILGENTIIRSGAYLRGNIIAGNNCVFGHGTEVKNTIFLNNTKASHFAYIGDSILGNDVNLGAGVKCANVRLDKKNIKVIFKEKVLETNFKKLGACIGDRSQIACNVVLNPGSLIFPETLMLRQEINVFIKDNK